MLRRQRGHTRQRNTSYDIIKRDNDNDIRSWRSHKITVRERTVMFQPRVVSSLTLGK
jgi:hypothetical protein